MRKKKLEEQLLLADKRISNLEERSYKMLEVLKASGILEALEEGEDMVTIPYRSYYGIHNNHYKVNEVF